MTTSVENVEKNTLLLHQVNSVMNVEINYNIYPLKLFIYENMSKMRE